MSGWLVRAATAPLDLLVPPRCLACRTPSRTGLCAVCDELVVVLDPLDTAAVLLDDGPAGRLVRAGKHGRAWGAATTMAQITLRHGRPARLPDAITWVPHDAGRARARGMHLPALYAAALARRLEVPAARLLDRQPGPAQRGSDLAARQHNVRNAFVARQNDCRAWVGAEVLLVDDVLTTGATLQAAAATLLAAEIAVDVLAFTAVPRRMGVA